jgi:hypothetical protein
LLDSLIPTNRSWSFISLGATAYLSSRLYEAGSGGRSPLADRVEIVKSAFSNVASCLTLPKSLYGGQGQPALAQQAAWLVGWHHLVTVHTSHVSAVCDTPCSVFEGTLR